MIERPQTDKFFSVEENADILKGYLRFKHRPNGQWHIQLMIDRDVQLAVSGMRQILAGKAVSVRF